MRITVDQTLHDTIERYVRGRFADESVDSVRVELDFDADGDEILNVTVVFGVPPKSIQIGNLTRTLWEKLSTRNDAKFPLFSFVTREEDARLIEAA